MFDLIHFIYYTTDGIKLAVKGRLPTLNKVNGDLKENIEKFFRLLDRKPDDMSSVHDFVMYLRTLLWLETDEELPKMEIMTLIKHYKPTVFYGLKKMAHQNIMLDILTHLSMDLETAEKNLRNIMD